MRLTEFTQEEKELIASIKLWGIDYDKIDTKTREIIEKIKLKMKARREELNKNSELN